MKLLKRKQQNQTQKSKGRKQKPAPKQRKSKSPNLLQSTLDLQSLETEKDQFRISKSAFVLIISIQVLFVFLSIFNSKTIDQIDRVQRTIKRQEAIVLSRNSAEMEIRNVIARTEALKRFERDRVLFAPKVLGFIDGLPHNIVLIRSLVEKSGMSLTVETNSALEIGLLISSYFNQKFANEITIVSANLNRSKGGFVTKLEITFK